MSAAEEVANMRIVECEFDDVLYEWCKKLWPNRQSAIEPTNPIRMELEPKDVHPTFFMAVNGNQYTMGVVSGFKTSPTHYRYRGIYVDEEYRRLGVGEALVRRMMEQARKEGCTTFWGMPRKSSVEFNESLGLHRVSDFDDSSYEFGPNCFMEMSLLPAYDTKLELTDGNHFQFGYTNPYGGSGGPFNYRTNEFDQWWVNYGRCKREPYDFRRECAETAKRIGEKTNKPIHLLFSGGLDSEVMVRAFQDAGVPFRAAVLRFSQYMNQHDIVYAMEYCKAKSIPCDIYDLDVMRFWDNLGVEYAQRTYSVSPQLLTTMWLVDQIPGYSVMGSAECYLVKRMPADYKPGDEYPHSEWDLHEKEKIAGWYRHFMVQNRAGCPGFFQYTPEIMLSFLRDPIVVDLVNDRIPGKLSTMSSKMKIYQSYYGLEPRKKYTGFENMVPREKSLRAFFEKRFRGADQVYKTPYGELIEMLRPDR